MDNELRAFIKKFETDVIRSRSRKTADPLLTTVMNSASLRRQLATSFINQVVDESTLLKMVRVMPVDAPSGDITKLNVNTHVTRGATENTASTETRRPVDSALTFTVKKTVSLMDVTGEWGEDNIEGEGGRSTAVTAFYRAIANDMETLAIEGDESVSGSTDYAALVSVNDGFHVQTGTDDGTYILNAGATRTSYKLLSQMLRLMPTKWKANKSDLRWFMSWNAAQDLVDEMTTRGTVFADSTLQNGVPPRILGIPIEIIPMIPEDLSLTGTSGTTGTFIWLTRPNNFIYVVLRDFKAEWERVPRSDKDELTIHMRTDFLVEEATAVVKATNVSHYEEVAYYGAA